jgi:hypothetical protein
VVVVVVVAALVAELQHLSLALPPSQTMRTGHWLVVVVVAAVVAAVVVVEAPPLLRT